MFPIGGSGISRSVQRPDTKAQAHAPAWPEQSVRSRRFGFSRRSASAVVQSKQEPLGDRRPVVDRPNTIEFDRTAPTAAAAAADPRFHAPHFFAHARLRVDAIRMGTREVLIQTLESAEKKKGDQGDGCKGSNRSVFG
jgi:hypothetical protein